MKLADLVGEEVIQRAASKDVEMHCKICDKTFKLSEMELIKSSEFEPAEPGFFYMLKYGEDTYHVVCPYCNSTS